MLPGTYQIRLSQNETYTLAFTYQDEAGDIVPLSEWTSKFTAVDSSGGDPVLELTSEGGDIVMTDEGEVTLIISADQTAALTSRVYNYDLFLFDTEDRHIPLLSGDIIVKATHTR